MGPIVQSWSLCRTARPRELLDLPNELLDQILWYLPAKDYVDIVTCKISSVLSESPELNAISQTSRRCYTIVQKHLSLNSINEKNFAGRERDYLNMTYVLDIPRHGVVAVSKIWKLFHRSHNPFASQIKYVKIIRGEDIASIVPMNFQNRLSPSKIYSLISVVPNALSVEIEAVTSLDPSETLELMRSGDRRQQLYSIVNTLECMQNEHDVTTKEADGVITRVVISAGNLQQTWTGCALSTAGSRSHGQERCTHARQYYSENFCQGFGPVCKRLVGVAVELSDSSPLL
jgi:hypothetical protein